MIGRSARTASRPPVPTHRLCAAANTAASPGASNRSGRLRRTSTTAAMKAPPTATAAVAYRRFATACHQKPGKRCASAQSPEQSSQIRWTVGIQSKGSISAASEITPITIAATTTRRTKSAMQPPPAVSLPELEAIAAGLVEDVLEAGAVAEAAQLDAHGRPVRAVLRARHEHDVCQPAARI